jgi:ferredoxin
MRITVDSNRCQGHNRCAAIAPDLFDIDELGNASEHAGGFVPVGEEDEARMAIANCPERAITVEESQ